MFNILPINTMIWQSKKPPSSVWKDSNCPSFYSSLSVQTELFKRSYLYWTDEITKHNQDATACETIDTQVFTSLRCILYNTREFNAEKCEGYAKIQIWRINTTFTYKDVNIDFKLKYSRDKRRKV